MQHCFLGNRRYRETCRRRRVSDLWGVTGASRARIRLAYRPHPYAYGLFQRVVHWTSQAMVGEPWDEETPGTSKRERSTNEYAKGNLHGLVHGDYGRASVCK